MANKSFCEDLTEGKFSFPLIHAINSADGESLVMRKLKYYKNNYTIRL